VYAQPNLMWVQALREDVPDLGLYDAHVHVGLRDPAGLQATEEEALDALEQVDSRALIFSLKEPAKRHRLELAQAHPDRLRTLARSNPGDDALGEAERCLDAGAVGLKLHPRAEGFEITDERLDDVFALADERRLQVMIHAAAAIRPWASDLGTANRRDAPPSHEAIARSGRPGAAPHLGTESTKRPGRSPRGGVYHAVSMMRRLLGVDSAPAAVSARAFAVTCRGVTTTMGP
jgi:hypothetical protein